MPRTPSPREEIEKMAKDCNEATMLNLILLVLLDCRDAVMEGNSMTWSHKLTGVDMKPTKIIKGKKKPH